MTTPADPAPQIEPRAGAQSMDQAITRFLRGVGFVAARLKNAALIAGVAGAVDAALGFVIDWRVGIGVAVLALVTVAVLLVYRRRLTRLLASDTEIRADLSSGALTPETRERVIEAVRRFESGGIQGRLGAGRGVGEALKDHPMATRAASIRETFIGPTLQLSAVALGVAGLLLIAIVPLAVVAILVTFA